MTYSKKVYEAPRARVADVKSRIILCTSPSGENTEGFTAGDNYYGNDDWE